MTRSFVDTTTPTFCPSKMKGRLSEEDIERMLQDAKDNGEEDRLVEQRIDARKGHSYGMENMLGDGGEGGTVSKIGNADKEVKEMRSTSPSAHLSLP